jgi:hypothetical protein
MSERIRQYAESVQGEMDFIYLLDMFIAGVVLLPMQDAIKI